MILASGTAREDITEYAGVELRSALFLNPSKRISNEGEGRHPLHINNTLTTTIHNRVKHYFVCIPTRQRLDALINLLKKEGVNGGGKVIVFLSCCDAVDYFHALFSLNNSPVRRRLVGDERNVQVHKLHGRMGEGERVAVLSALSREGGSGDEQEGALILFSTDVAARGVDFPSITCTIQYDAPLDPNDYMHRAGRSGRRGGGEGTSYLVLMPSERGLVERLERRSGWEIRKKRIVDREDDESMGSDWQKGFESWTVDAKNAITLTLKQSHHANAGVQKQERIAMHELAVRACAGTLRAYATHRAEMRDMLHPRKLHMGHLAACFGLAKAPSLLLGNDNKRVKRMSMGKKSERDKVDVKRARLLDVKKREGRGREGQQSGIQQEANEWSIREEEGWNKCDGE